jgi:hypothetical protein
MAYQVAKGNGPNTGMQKNVAPTRPAAPDEITAIRAPTKPGYGMNGDTSRSSTSPGELVQSPLAKNLEASSDSENLLNRIRHGEDVELQSPQTRKVDATPYKTTFGMSGAKSGPKIPAKCGASEAPPVRKPS